MAPIAGGAVVSWHERPYADGHFDPPRQHSRFGENPMGWSLHVGRVFGIDLRVHIFFLLYVAGELLGSGGGLGYEAAGLAILFGIVLLHEFGHCIAARKVGGEANEILMWPLGGLAYVQAPPNPFSQFITVAGGPAVNVLICLLTGLLLAVDAGTPRAVPWNFLTGGGIAPRFLESWVFWIDRTYRMSYAILLFNLLPMYPLDGGRLLQAILWPRLGRTRATRVSTTVGMIGALVLGLCGLQSGQLMIVAVAAFGYITCMQERQWLAAAAVPDDGYGGYESAGGQDEFNRPRRRGILPFRRWRERALARRLQRKREEERSMEREVDRILQKVHDEGLHSLTRGERKLLETATRRQRARDDRD